jgi:two-component system phosphate regulon sensor histidine kinase PhoR
LLALSRLEQETESGILTVQPVKLQNVVLSAWQACAHKAAEKNILCEIETGLDPMLRVNQPLLEQAVVNLIDNAINYSEPNRTIRVGLEKSDSEWIIYVQDEGYGIAPEHLPRIFERFYRVDKTRSRKMGGTGLGLAIVKHIALAHKGSVSVESIPNQGSTFRIHLPQ